MGTGSRQTWGASGADSSGPNLPLQRVGPNDLVSISVYGAPELTRSFRVGADGMLRLPMLGTGIKAQELMPADLEVRISERLRDAGLFIAPIVSVSIAEYASRAISVVGAVRHPLTFQASTPISLLEALARAEGLSPEAGPELLVTLNSPGPPVRIVIKDLLEGTNPDLNLLLTGREQIRVPERGRFYVVGNVKKPGSFPYHEAKEDTVLKALALSEGLLPYSNSKAYILRKQAGVSSEIPVELKRLMLRKTPDVGLLEGDILYVPDAKGARAGLAVLEKALVIGSAATTALIYAGVR